MSGPRPPLSRLLGWAAIALLATYCLFIGGSWIGTYNAYIRVITLGLVAIGLGVWLIVAIRDPWWRPRTALWPAFGISLAVMAIATMTSPFPRLGIEYLAWAVILTCLYLILQRLMSSPYFSVRVLTFATACAFVVSIVYIVIVVGKWIEWWDLIGRIAAPPLRPGFESLTFGNPSAVMTASVLLTATAVAVLTDGSRRRAALAVVAVVLALIVTLLSGSRAGWLALAVACVATGILWLVPSSHRRTLMSIARSRSARILLVPLLVVGIAVAVIAGPGILLRASAGGDAYRTAYNAVSFRMMESSPLVGLGPGTWAPLRTSFTVAPDPDYYIPHAHDIYLQTLSEFGILGLAAGVVVAWFLLRLLYRAIRDPDATRRRFGWCALFATIYFAGHQVLDFYANAPSILFAFAIPIAFLDATGAPSPAGQTSAAKRVPATSWARPLAGVIGVLAVVGSIGLLAWADVGASKMLDGTVALNRDDVSGGLTTLTDAVAADPAMPVNHFARGLALAESGRLVEAEPEFLESASTDDLPEAWLNLAAVRARLGDADGSRAALNNAMRLGSQQAGVALGAGATWLELGDRTEAVDALAQALALVPSLAGDSWWTQDAERAAVWTDVYATAFDRAGPSGKFELAMETGDTQAAEAAIASMTDPEARRISELVLNAWGGDDAALADLAATAKARPLDGGPVNWLARIHGLRGDEAEQRRYQDWSGLILARADTGAAEVRVDDGSRDGAIAGVSTLFSGHYSYRRPTPLDQFVPWLPDLVAQ